MVREASSYVASSAVNAVSQLAASLLATSSHLLRDEVVVLRGLVGHGDAVSLRDLTSPHPPRIHHLARLYEVLRPPLPLHLHPSHLWTVLEPALSHREALHLRPLPDVDAVVLGGPSEGHGCVVRVDASVRRHLEACQNPLHAQHRHPIQALARGQLTDVHAAVAVEGGYAPVLL